MRIPFFNTYPIKHNMNYKTFNDSSLFEVLQVLIEY